MNAIVLVFNQVESPELRLRCEAIGEFLCRMKSINGGWGTPLSAPADVRSAMSMVSRHSALFSEGSAVHYAPTRRARSRVVAGQDGDWGSVAARQKSRARPSAGAIFDFPLESADAPDSGQTGAVQAFITDWSGVHGACALAVHPAHPLSPGVPEGAEAAFTGRFCRHPLTGDLLPIWVATWVKAEFGTGAVLINPAHSKADLEFGRRVGLPIRFALVPPDFDGTPKTWPKPPYIKSGVAHHTGATDGLPFDQAREKYFAAIAENGLAERCTDNGMGAFQVATIIEGDGDAADAAQIEWDVTRRTIAGGAGSGRSVRIVPSAALAAAEPTVRSAELTIVTPSSLVEKDLLAARLILAEPDIEPPVENAPEVRVVGAAVSKVDAVPAALGLAMLVTAKPLDTLTLKPQHIEPCERFLQVHEELAATQGDAGLPANPEVEKAGAQVKALLLGDDLKRGFNQLYRMQKQLAKSETKSARDLAIYHTLAFVLVGVSAATTEAAMTDVWNSL